jgi:hypothetical protein
MSLLAVGQRLRRIGLGAVAAAALVVGAGAMAPAQAHDYRHGWWGHHEQHRHYGDHHRGRDMRMMFRVFGHLFHG